MRVFLCDYGAFFVAIPLHSVASIALYLDEEAQLDLFTYIEELRSTFVSLPHLFNLPENRIQHYIFLKNDETENTTVLLSTKVVCETEISDEETYPVPTTLSGTRFYMLFSGMLCTRGNPVLLLDTEELLKYVHKEMAL